MENNICLNDIMDESKEVVVVFYVDTETFRNHLTYHNKAASQLLMFASESDIEEMTLEKLLNINQDELRELLFETLDGRKSQEKRIISLTNGKGEVFEFCYQVFDMVTNYAVQIVIKSLEKSNRNEELIEVEHHIDEISFDNAYIVLMSIKNMDVILKAYGSQMVDKVMQLIEYELEQVFDCDIEVIKGKYSFLMAISFNYENIMEVYNQFIKRLQDRINDEDINVICDIKIGISSYTDNIYFGLREAKYSLNEVYNISESVLDYTVPSEQLLKEYIIEKDLPYALEKEELSVVFQGIYNIQESYLYGFEVLVRWDHKELGRISPSMFIPVAENSELISKLDLWVVEQALKEFEELSIPGKSNLKLNFNVSPRDFLTPRFADSFIELIDRSSLEFSNIILEITETLNLYPERSSLQKIKDKGVMIALDDFGTGFSSLSQIKHYQIDFLKIDISFTRDINKNYDNTLITNAILGLAKNLNISVIAEGVEDHEQIEFLKSRKCEFVQGFKLHKPTSFFNLSRDIDANYYQQYLDEVKTLSMSYKDYVGFYEYGKLIYLLIDESGYIIENSDLLVKTLGYDIRKGERVQSIVINGLGGSFNNHLQEVVSTGSRQSFMTELVGLKNYIPVKATIIKNDGTGEVDVFFEDFSEKRDTYERIKNIYNRYDLIFKGVNTAIIVSNTDMVIQEWNQQAENTFGYSTTQAVGNNLVKLLVDGKYHDGIGNIISKTLSGKETDSINENIRKDGGRIMCQWHNSQLINEEGELIGVVSWVMDITEKLRIEEELNYLSTVIKQESAPIVITNFDGEIEYVNDAFTEVTGYTFEEVRGANPSILSSGLQSEEFYQKLWNTITSGNVWEGEFKNKKKNGEIYITSSRIVPIKNEKGFIKQFSCIQKDITREIEKDNQIKEISETLEKQERLSMIGQMAAGIMHEINNPLSYIDMNVSAFSNLLDRINVTSENEIILDELKEIGIDLEDGIENIKEIASGLKRFTYQDQSNEYNYVDLNEEIKSIAIVSKNEYKYFCELLIESGEIGPIFADAGRIKQVLLNLIINAVHAIKDKGDEWGKIIIRTYEETEYICCDIEDTGGGIAPDIQDKIFDSFFTTKEEGRGTGLGLSLSKKIIETEHQGLLLCSSEIGVGTTFTVKFKKSEVE